MSKVTHSGSVDSFVLSQRKEAFLRQEEMRLSSRKRAQRIDSHSVFVQWICQRPYKNVSFRNFYNLCLSLCYTSNRETEASPLKLEHIFFPGLTITFSKLWVFIMLACAVRLSGMSYEDAGSKLSSREKLLPRMAGLAGVSLSRSSQILLKRQRLPLCTLSQSL